MSVFMCATVTSCDDEAFCGAADALAVVAVSAFNFDVFSSLYP